MKTGFLYGYPNKPGKKRYSYHGLERDCLIQPSPDPFEDYPIGPPLGNWILVFDGPIWSAWYGYYIFKPSGFLVSSDDYLCPNGLGTKKNIYYFSEVTIFPYKPGQWMNLHWADGLNCKGDWIGIGKYQSIYKAWFNIHWYKYDNIWNAFNISGLSYARVWKSEDGEFPGYYPVPQQEIIIT